jgi:hypothetical protein
LTAEEKEFFYEFTRKKRQMSKMAFTRLANQLERTIESDEYDIDEVKQMLISLK